jgi:hypothetical protein
MGGSGGAQTRMPIPRPLPLNFAIVTRDRSGNDRHYVRCASSEGNCIYIIDIKRDRSYCRTHAGASPPPAAAHHRLNPKKGGSSDRPKLTPIETLPQRQPPVWLRLLGWGQAGSVLFATGLVGSVFVLYGFTVQTNRQLSTATRQLQALQTQAQQLVTGKAILRHHLVKQTAAGGVTPLSQGVIFLEPETAPEVPVPSAAPPASKPATSARPLGY